MQLMFSKLVFFLIIPLILSIGIAPALPFVNAGMSDVSECGQGLVLAKNLQHGYFKCMDSSRADRFAQLGIVELVTEESEKPAMEKPKMEKPKMEKPAPLSFLFIQMATSGSFIPTDDGKYTLTLEGINPQTIFFTDRPNRIAGHMLTENFVPIWTMGKDSFEKDPPNAAITILEADETENAIIVELTNPVYDSETMTLQYTAQIIPDVTDGLSHFTEQVDTSIPEEFGHVAVFIDDFNLFGEPDICKKLPACDEVFRENFGHMPL